MTKLNLKDIINSYYGITAAQKQTGRFLINYKNIIDFVNTIFMYATEFNFTIITKYIYGCKPN